MNELNWKRSSFCGGGGNNCVEVAVRDDTRIAIRHSVHPNRGFSVDRGAFAAFVSAVGAGEPEATAPAV